MEDDDDQSLGNEFQDDLLVVSGFNQERFKSHKRPALEISTLETPGSEYFYGGDASKIYNFFPRGLQNEPQFSGLVNLANILWHSACQNLNGIPR